MSDQGLGKRKSVKQSHAQLSNQGSKIFINWLKNTLYHRWIKRKKRRSPKHEIFKGKNGELWLVNLLVMKWMKAIFLICLFPGHLQHSSCVGRVQMFCPESGAAVWHCKTYAKALRSCRLWKFTVCCSRGKSLLLYVGGIAWQTAFLPFRLLLEFFCLLTRTYA